MKSKTSLFNSGIFRNTLKRYWFLFVLYGITLGFPVLGALFHMIPPPDTIVSNPQASCPTLLPMPDYVVTVCFIASGIIAVCLFSYLYHTRQTGLMASLPITRESMYLSISAAGFAGIMLVNLVVVGLMFLVELLAHSVQFTSLWTMLLLLTLSSITFLGMAVFSAVLTGNALVGLAIYGMLNLFIPAIEYFIWTFLQEVIYGMPPVYFSIGNSPLISLCLSPLLNLCMPLVDFNTQDLSVLPNTVSFGIYAVVGFVFLLVGLNLYKKRHMEVSGNAFAYEWLKPLFKLVMALSCGLVFAALIRNLLKYVYFINLTRQERSIHYAILVIVGGLIGLCIAQMLLDKSIRVFHKVWKGAIVFALIVLVGTTAVAKDLFGYERNVPNADEVASVGVALHHESTPLVIFKDTKHIEELCDIHQDILDNRKLHERSLTEYLYAGGTYHEGYSSFPVKLMYTQKDGSTLVRYYELFVDPEMRTNPDAEINRVNDLMNSEEAISYRYMLPFSVKVENIDSYEIRYVDKKTFASIYAGETLHTNDSQTILSKEDIVSLYNDCIVPDINDGQLGQMELNEITPDTNSIYDCDISIRIAPTSEQDTFTPAKNIRFYLPTSATRTVKFLKTHGISPATQNEVHEHEVAEYEAYYRNHNSD